LTRASGLFPVTQEQIIRRQSTAGFSSKMLAEVPTGIQQNPDSSIAAAPRTTKTTTISPPVTPSVIG
jgi:hypothetical protein